MIPGGPVAMFFAVDAEGKSLEDIAKPLSVIAKPAEASFGTGAPRSSRPPRPSCSARSVSWPS